MKPRASMAEPDAEKKIPLLIRTLRETVQELHKLTGGQIDAVADAGGQPFLLGDAQDQLRQSETRYRALAAATAQIIWTANAEGQVFGVLPEWQDYTGQSVEEIQSDGWAKALHPDDKDHVLKVWMEAVQSRTSYNTEYRLRRHDGVYRDFAVRGVPVRMLDGTIQEWVGCCMDITEKKRAEESLKLFRALIDQSSDAIEVIDPMTGRFIDMNETAWRRLGYTREEMLSMGILDIETTAVTPASLLGHLEKIRTGGPKIIQGGHRRKDGSTFPVEVSLKCIRLDRDYMIAVVRDITVRQKTEDERDRLFNLSEDLLAIGSMDGRLVQVNPAWTRSLGWSQLEMTERPWLDFVHPDDREATIGAGEHQNSGQPLRDFENRYRCKNGSYRWLSWNVYPLMESRQLFCVARDVSQRKQAEEAIQEKDKLIRMAGQLTRTGGWFMEMPGQQLFWSDVLCDIMEAPHGHTPPLSAALELHPAKSRDPVASALAACVREGKAFDLETEIDTVQGRRIWGRVCGEAERDANGKTRRVWGAFQDITDQKLANVEFIKNQNMLRVASRIGRLGAWQVRVPVTHVQWSDETAAIHEEPPGFSPSVEDAIDYYAPEYRGVIRDAFGACIEKGTPFDVEAQIITAKGTSLWVRALGEAVRRPDGTIIQVQGALQDIDNMKQAEERLTEQATLLDSAHEAILVKDMQGQIVYWNKGAERAYGWRSEEALGQKYVKLLQNDERKYEAALAVLMSKGAWVGEMIKQSKDGRELTVDVSWTLVRDKKGQPKSVLSIATDITERKQLEAQFLRAQRMESIGTLAGGIAHDLNNILSPIMMSIDVLKETTDNPQAETILNTIAVSAKRGADIVRQVLSFARGVEGERVEIDPKNLLEDLEHIIKDTFPKNILLQFSAAEDGWVILGDPTQVHQILLNLCVNARDAMPRGGHLTIEAENCVLDEQYAAMNIEAKAGRYVKIAVTDTGTGMSSEVTDKIFEPFFTTKEADQGTGLGLSTVRAIVKSHEGSISVYSEPGKGTTFNIYLPAVQIPSEGRNPLDLVSSPRGKGETVLVVDDENSILTITRQTLQSFGYRVMTATDGADGVSVYAEHQHEIDVVLTDMRMPVMDGRAMIHALLEINPKIKIIAASGLNTNTDPYKDRELGVTHFLTKPYTSGIMLRTLRTILDET